MPHMMTRVDGFDMADAWDRASAEYLARRGDDVDTVSYGNIVPSEAEVQLLGRLHGLRVLDYGCGGGQNAVACAAAGALVTGVDISEVQLAAAARLAQAYGHTIQWIHGALPSAAIQAQAPFDLVLAIQVLPYVEDAAATLHDLCALIASGGQLVLSLDHPVRNCFFDTEADELSPFPLRAYVDRAVLRWNFAPGVPMLMYHAPLSQWIGRLTEAGLILEQVIEASAPLDVCDRLWPVDSPLEPLRHIPHTAILVCRAP